MANWTTGTLLKRLIEIMDEEDLLGSDTVPRDLLRAPAADIDSALTVNTVGELIEVLRARVLREVM